MKITTLTPPPPSHPHPRPPVHLPYTPALLLCPFQQKSWTWIFCHPINVHNLAIPLPCPSVPANLVPPLQRKTFFLDLASLPNSLTRELKIRYGWYFRDKSCMIIFLEMWIVLNTIQCVYGFYDGSRLIFLLFRSPFYCTNLLQTKAVYGEGI